MNISSIATAGLDRASAKIDTIAKRVSGGSDEDTVDLSTDIVGLLQARNLFTANINVLKTADDLDKATLSLLA